MRIFNRQSGFSLLEMLVATLVLSFGLLGIAGMQTISLRNNSNAYMRTQANLLAYSIVDSMRANRDAALAGSYDIAINAAAPTGSTQAETDLAEWLGALQVLPEGDGAVDCDANEVCTITVQWIEISSTRAPTSLMLSTQI